MIVALVACLAFASTLCGGFFAMRFSNSLRHIMALTAGVILGVVGFDVLPEIFSQLQSSKMDPVIPMGALVIGFLVFHVLEKALLIHHGHEGQYAEHKHPSVGVASAIALVGHSFMDGLGIGVGFQINTMAGILVAAAVISHDFADGMNTVVLMLHQNNSRTKAKMFLLFDALAPIAGALSTTLFCATPAMLLCFLGFFAGFLLYIGASDILPEAHAGKSSYRLIALTVLGAGLIFVVTRIH